MQVFIVTDDRAAAQRLRAALAPAGFDCPAANTFPLSRATDPLPGPGAVAVVPLTAADCAAAWADLASADAAKGFAAVCRLTDDPKQSLPFLKERLRPATPIHSNRSRSAEHWRIRC